MKNHAHRRLQIRVVSLKTLLRTCCIHVLLVVYTHVSGMLGTCAERDTVWGLAQGGGGHGWYKSMVTVLYIYMYAWFILSHTSPPLHNKPLHKLKN